MTDNLKELTLENHRRTERSAFLRRILKKTITPYQYYLYLSNQFLMYSILEDQADNLGIFDTMEVIKRTNNMRQDLEELEQDYGFETPVVTDATQRYYEYVLNDIADDYIKIMAHVYVRHMGDLYGGQVIKKLVPGSGNHYKFEGDIDALKAKFRIKLNDTLVDEARVCFDMIGTFLEELEMQVNDLDEINRNTEEYRENTRL